MADQETLGVYAKQAQEYADKFQSSKPDRHLRAYMERLNENAHVLELGCGTGQAARFLIDAGFRVDAWDASPEMAAIGADKFNLKIDIHEFQDLDVRDYYDGVYANFSLLHAPRADMPANLDRIASALKPGGQFHIGLKLGKGEKRDHLGRFYAYFEEDELVQLLADAGLTTETRYHGEGPGLAGTVDPWIILHAKK